MTGRAFLLPILVLLGSSAGPAVATTELVAEINHPRLGAPVALETLVVGRGVISGPGASWRELVCGSTVCGLAFEGPATLRYRVEDAFSRPLARRNLKHATAFELHEDGTGAWMEAALRAGALWGVHPERSGEPGDGPGADGAPEEGAVEALPARLGEILEKRRFLGPGEALVAWALQGQSQGVWGLLDGEREDLVLTVEPDEEDLLLVEEVSKHAIAYPGFSRLRNLVAQPLPGESWWNRRRIAWDTVFRSIQVRQTDEESLAIESRITLRARSDGQRGWAARLDSERFDNQGRSRPFEVASVRVDGAPAEFVHEHGWLLVFFPRPVAKGTEVVVEIASGGRVAIRPQGSSYWWLRTSAWYPRSPWLVPAPFELEVETLPGNRPFASGELVAETVDEGAYRLRTRSERPREILVVAAGDFQVVEERRGDTLCRVGTYVFANESGAQRLIDNFFAGKAFYEGVLGEPFPFRTMNIVEIDDWGYGQAPPNLIFLSHEAFDSIGDYRSRVYSQGVNERVLHEIGHAYFGHVVIPDYYEENWLSESFAEYLAGLALVSARDGEGARRRELGRLLKGWEAQVDDIGDGASIYLADRLTFEADADSWARTFLLYGKGPIVVHALRQELARRLGPEQGDRVFFALLRSLIVNFRDTGTGTRHLVGILEQITKEPWQPWFERFVYGTEVPEVSP